MNETIEDYNINNALLQSPKYFHFSSSITSDVIFNEISEFAFATSGQHTSSTSPCESTNMI